MISVRTVTYIIVMILTVATATGLPVLIDACCTDVVAESCSTDTCCPEGTSEEDEPCCDLIVSVQHADQGSGAKECSIPSPMPCVDQTVFVSGATSVAPQCPPDGSETVNHGRYRSSLVLTPRSEHTGSFLI